MIQNRAQGSLSEDIGRLLAPPSTFLHRIKMLSVTSNLARESLMMLLDACPNLQSLGIYFELDRKLGVGWAPVFSELLTLRLGNRRLT
jgi:hypothetical protein